MTAGGLHQDGAAGRDAGMMMMKEGSHQDYSFAWYVTQNILWKPFLGAKTFSMCKIKGINSTLVKQIDDDIE